MSGASSSQSVSGINSYSSRIQTINLQSFKLHLLLTWSRTYMKLAEYLLAALLLLITIVNIQDLLEIRMVAENTDPHPGYVDSSPYETEFVDATITAHAAAESAERVSFPARAAVELSSKERMRMTMQSSTESPNSSSYDNIRNEPSHRHSSSNVQSGENASWKRDHSRDNSLEMRQSDSFAKVGRAKQQPIKDDVNDSCSEDVQLKKQSSLASSSSHTSYVSDDNNIIFEDKRFQSTVEDTERKSHGHDVAPVMVTADKKNASWKRGHSRDNSLEMRQSDSFAKVGRAKQQPIKDDVNDSCSEDVQLKKQSSLASSSSHTSYVSDDNNIIFEDKRFQSTVEDTERKSHGHDVAPVMVTADKSILSVFVLCCLSRLFMDWV
ncbi:hypothetical protein DY000_02025075 [Brassica cretica]|uniref:DUF4005 domain-containing protein n=1 Tax=Brassica cretica TaxID=69181 RepID=A0ABQ7E8F4_BRACR|nr:hypothetical protein DY000_02025075 [Brassica cretica]